MYSSVLKSVKKCSKRAYLRSSLEFLIYLSTFSLLTVTPLDTWLASSCTRVTIWSHLLLERHLYSSSFSTKLPMQGVTRCVASLERDPLSGEYGVSPRTPSLWSRLLLSRSALLAHRTCSGKLFPCLNLWPGNDYLITSSFVLVPLEGPKQAFLILRRCPSFGGLWSLGRLSSHTATMTHAWWPTVRYARDRRMPT